MSEHALEFFNKLSGRLEIELTEPAKPMSPNLLNLEAPPEARVVSVSLKLKVWLPETKSFRPLTDEEWSRVVLREAHLKMRGESDVIVEHHAPNGEHFTTRDLADAVALTERNSRDESEWFARGGICGGRPRSPYASE